MIGRSTTSAGLTASVVLAAVLLTSGLARSQPSGFDALSVDMNPSGNTDISLGSRQECREALPGATFNLDITVENVSSTTPLLGYEYAFEFPGPTVTITGHEPVMIASKAASQLFNVSDPVPQFGTTMRMSVLDIGEGDAHESGSGVLDRLTIDVSTDASPGIYAFTIPEAVLLDHQSNPHSPPITRNGRLAIGVSCSGSTPLPDVTASVTPVPTDATGAPNGTTAPTIDEPTPPLDASPSGATATQEPGSGSPTHTPGPYERPSPSASLDGRDDDGSSTPWIALAVVAVILVSVVGGWLAYRRYGQRST